MINRIKCNLPTYFDIDDTLIIWAPTEDLLEKYGLDYSFTFSDGVTRTGRLLPHRAHVRQLIRHAQRGHTIILWSAGGEEWAYAVAKLLELDKYGMIYTMEKPRWAYDDKKASDFIETKYHDDDDGSPL